MKYKDCVARFILWNNAHGIKDVKALTTLEDLVFDFDRYPEVKLLMPI
ncbi:MAG: hypothetical protein J7599_22530 [Niabella sp.]|nr:hypothetical protein [Niabella sp.]